MVTRIESTTNQLSTIVSGVDMPLSRPQPRGALSAETPSIVTKNAYQQAQAERLPFHIALNRQMRQDMQAESMRKEMERRSRMLQSE